jgi:thioredoxin-like negative regulator of GroEL
MKTSKPQGDFPACAQLLRNGFAVTLLWVLACGTAIAQTRFTPAADQVVLPVSVHAIGAGNSTLREAERDWRRDPKDMQLAIRYARTAFQVGLNEGDLRWFGAAKAAMLPWWNAAELPADGHFVRGLVRQGFHDFGGGLADFSAAIALDGQRSAFWSWRFVIHLLLSDMAAARQDCATMRERFGTGEGEACEAVLMYRSGKAAQAAALLERTVQRPEFQDSGSQDWLRFHLGEAWRVAGQPARAIAAWEAHLNRQPRAHSVRLALVELLNERGQFAEAKRLAVGPNTQATPSDALLVQWLLASRGLGDGDTARLATMVNQRMASQADRGETLIERPRMIYLIRYGHDPAAGLALAVANWASQNEPPDAVLLAEAALKLNQPKAAEPVLDWMARTGYQEPALTSLAQQLKAALGRS